MKIVGFHSGHDVSYCILEDGIVTVCEELERITRSKMQIGDGLDFFRHRYDKDDIKYITFGNPGGREDTGEYYTYGHHLSHASNSYFTSPFNRALIITIDAGGNEEDMTRTAMTVSEGIGNKVNRIAIFPISEINIGGIWHDSTKNIFGLSVGYPKGDQAGTVMAMATIGKPLYTNMFNNFRSNAGKLKELADISEQSKFDVAASLQEWTEKKFLEYLSEYLKDCENLCLSGGVSLNCVMTGKIKKWFPNIKNVFCDPVPYDAGLSLGSARYLWHNILGNPKINNIKNMSPYMGKSYSKEDVLNACSKNNLTYKEVSDEDVIGRIDNQKVVAVYGGGSETGRRALGNRSILADPRNNDMKEIINSRIKHRQWFRPFAPSILEDRVDDWFEDSYLSPYMSFAVKFKENLRSKVPAVVHYDGTGRLQTVSKELNPWYYNFIEKWEKTSGVPIILNTSFNDTEPIVETPEDSIGCFLRTELDSLYFFDYGLIIDK
jgi:carbamoyltransferase